jgi:hypothetical protein
MEKSVRVRISLSPHNRIKMVWDKGACSRKGLGVRVSPKAPKKNTNH